MSSATHGSEEVMVREAAKHLVHVERPRILVGGLGLGYTLRATLDAVGEHAEVVCVELMSALVDWHRGPLGELANHPIDDPRVTVVHGDVVEVIKSAPGEGEAYDAILLDVDNGPIPMTVTSNWWLYAAEGLAGTLAALRPGGVLVVWSAGGDAPFARRMSKAGFETEVRRVAARSGRRSRRGHTHVLFVGQRPSP